MSIAEIQPHIPRDGVVLQRLTLDQVDSWEVYETVMIGRAMITLDIQIGTPYLFYSNVVDGSRYWMKPPDWAIQAVQAWLSSYRSIEFAAYMNKMFNEE